MKMHRCLLWLLVLLLLLPFAVQAVGGWPPPPRWVLVHQRSVNIAPNGGWFDFGQFSGGNDIYKIQFDMFQSTGDNGSVELRLTYGLSCTDPSAPYYSIGTQGWAYTYSGTFSIDVSRSNQSGRLKGTVRVWRRDDM